MAVFETDTFGIDNPVSLRINGEEIVYSESYDVTKSILSQPAQFSMRLGYGGIIKDLIPKVRPNSEVQLFIGDVLQMTGRIDGYEIGQDTGGTELTVFGRDALAALHDAFIEAEFSLTDATYETIVSKALDTVVGPHTLFFTNDANRKLTSGIGTKAVGGDVTQRATGATQKVVRARIGERWYEYLKRQLDRAGLFLWAGGNGEFVLAEPNAKQAPAYRVIRRRDIGETILKPGNVIRVRHRNDTSCRFTEAKMYGRGGGKKFGNVKTKAVFVDSEMVAYGFNRPLVARDTNVTNDEQAQFYARRKLAESRRQGWSLTYTLAGHMIPSLVTNTMAVWTPDTVVDVQDEELGISGNHWIERVRYARSSSGTTTEITLMRPDDLVFATGEAGL